MRVIAGIYRSRRLRSLPGRATRPTSDRLRETLFNVVAGSIEGSVWLDLYAGTAGVGIEALSRGARMVYFVESSQKAAAVIRANLRDLGVVSGYELLERDALIALRELEADDIACDFCFLDPPYGDQKAYADALGFLSQSRLLHEKGVVIAEHDKHFDPGDAFGTLGRYRVLKQGDAVLSFYRKVPTADSRGYSFTLKVNHEGHAGTRRLAQTPLRPLRLVL
ncbi:MAG: 16S rRNA (guanine(966)-N(2))-methyltransferase RsmD [Terriglobales bacterium]